MRRALSRICIAAAATALALALAEAGLRLALTRLPMPLADELGSGYRVAGTGIYRFDPSLNMIRMRPHYRREMFFNGYFWHHQTDWMGFRNPSDRDRYDIVLIGDSMIYGHGLEETSTVRSHLERLTGRPVANLGMQSGAMDTEYMTLRHDAVRLSPQWVFIFFLNNDISDIVSRVSDDEIHRFLALPKDDHTTRYYNIVPYHGSGNFALSDLYVVRYFALLKNELEKNLRRRPSADGVPIASAAAPGQLPAPGRGGASAAQPYWIAEPPFAGNPRMQLAMRFHLRAILKSDDFARRHHFRFAYVFIAVPQPYDMLYERIIADYCRTHGVDFLSLRQTYARAWRAGVKLYLPNDGHLSDAGARVTAQALADRFNLRSPLKTSRSKANVLPAN